MRGMSMFARLLTVFLSVLLVCVVVLSVLSYVHLRSIAIENRMSALKTQARDMAYLASRQSSYDYSSATEAYMRWKSSRIYQEYNAYILVVDRYGRTHVYYNEATLQDETLKATPGKAELAEYMEEALAGREVVRQTQSASGPLFTVLAPWVQEVNGENVVMGFVLIQTAAQTVHASYRGLLWQTALAAGVFFVVAAAAVFLIARQMTRPLSVMAQAAGAMARGNFSVRAPEGGSREVRELAQAFNQMGAQLSTLEQSRRDFVANVSHELRSPVTSIQGFAQGMLDGTIPQEEHAKYLTVVVDETHRLVKLIHNLLDLSRMESDETHLHFTYFDVNELARRVLISRMTQIDEKQLDVDADFEEDACFVRADADQIQQVVINLLDNAVKYTPQGGRIVLTTKTNGNQVSLRVRDNGAGILPEDAPHIFDRFYMADKARTAGMGTGLGLAICRRIMEKHGQSIRLVSGEGGAEFEITLEKSEKPGGHHADAGAGKD